MERDVTLRVGIVLAGLSLVGCLGAASPGQDGGSESPRDAVATSDRLELCVENDARLPATVQLFRDGQAVGAPVHAEGYARSCRSMPRGEMVGTLDARVDPVGPSGRHFPEALRDMLVTDRSTQLAVTLSWDGARPYAQSTYRIRNR